MAEALIRVEALGKVFRQGFTRKRVEAVKSVSFEVARGDIFGFLGPNGAGKTTTIKMLTGLIFPTSGKASVFGEAIPSARAMQRVGFLPENPYVYPYLTPNEFVELCGRLSGLSGKALVSRTKSVLELVGIAYAADRPVRRLSKGMLQRTGLAAALVADPELLILDEPMSGLDPVGRKEVRDIIMSERANGRTIFFSSHILSDVESMCDHVTILRKGSVVVSGRLSELLKSQVKRTNLVIGGASEKFEENARDAGHQVSRMNDRLSLEVEGDERVTELVKAALEQGFTLLELVPRHETLEDLFVREAIEEVKPKA